MLSLIKRFRSALNAEKSCDNLSYVFFALMSLKAVQLIFLNKHHSQIRCFQKLADLRKRRMRIPEIRSPD